MTVSRNRTLVNSIFAVLFGFLFLACFLSPESAAAESAPYSVTMEEYISARKANPGSGREYTFELFGQEVNSKKTTSLEYLRAEIGDDGLERFHRVLPYLPNLKRVSFDRCGTTDEAVAALRDEFPEKEIVWRIFFSPFSAMTDIETIWAAVDLRNENCAALKYCTKVKNLDIGHCAMTDLSFLDYMPDLEVLIIACSDFNDISHVANCKKLTYFECAECVWLTDLSPIAELKNLEHLNVGGCKKVTDLSCLHHLDECKNLKRFYAQNMTNLALDMKKEEAFFRELLPNVEMDFAFYGGMGSLNTGFWRFSRGSYEGHYVEPYQHIRDIFKYDDPYSQPRLWGG